jgi:hypothetical protein
MVSRQHSTANIACSSAQGVKPTLRVRGPSIASDIFIIQGSRFSGSLSTSPPVSPVTKVRCRTTNCIVVVVVVVALRDSLR